MDQKIVNQSEYKGPEPSIISSNLRVLVTGSEGFVGKESVRFLQAQGVTCIGFDIVNGWQDLGDPATIEHAITTNQINRILHLAAIARFADADRDPLKAYEVNCLGTANISRIASKYHIPVVYASTGSVYMPLKGQPPITEDFPVQGNSVYGCSKAIGEKYIQQCSAPWIILRYAHLYGKEKRMHGLIGGFLERMFRGLSPILYGGKQSNDFTYIKDVATANYLALTASWDKWNQCYNIGTGEEITAEEAGRIICELTGYKGKVEIKEGREVDPQRFVFDISKAEQMLGFKAKYSFREGLADMFNGEREQKKI